MPSNEHRQCDEQRLAALAMGRLGDAQRLALAEHLDGCAACRDQLRWIERVGLVLGSGPGAAAGHPGSAELAAHAAGELEPEQQAEVGRHLGSCLPCRRLELAARAGLEELDRLEAGANAGSDTVHQVLPLPRLPALRAAADDLDRPAPAPADRRVLDEQPGCFRLVYYRRRAHGVLALFHEPDSEMEVQRCSLDSEELAPQVLDEGQVFVLGPAGDLWGRTVQIRFQAGGRQRDLSFTLVQED